MPTITRQDETTFAAVLDAAKRVLLHAGLGDVPSVRVARLTPEVPPLTTVSSNLWIVSLGPDWTRPYGVEMDTGSEVILDGEIHVSHWYRDDKDEADLQDSQQADPVHGNDGSLLRLLTLMGEDEAGNLCDSRAVSPLMQPLQLTNLRTPAGAVNSRWRAFTAVFYCQLRLRV